MSEAAPARRLIDWHLHVWLEEHLGPEWGPELQSRYDGQPVGEMASFEQADEARREAGVDVAVVIALTSRHLRMSIPNEFVAEYVARDPASTIGFASVDPNSPRAVDELRDAATTLGLKGLKLSPPYQDFHPHAPEAMRVYAAAAELGLPVMFHQGAVFMPRGVLEVANPALLDKVAREFPDLRIIVAHAGQPWYAETVALMYKHRNVFADLSARFHRPWQLHNILLAAIDYRVADRILFGTDFPVLRPQYCVDALRAINETTGGRLPPIPPQLIEQIIHERPLSLLGLD
jgi:predicted TIM-barrel fold metal-dependent hydrolase